MAIIDSGNDAAGKANVDGGYHLKVALPTNPEFVGEAVAVARIDDGSATGVYETKSIDIDEDYKLRTGIENILDAEIYNYTAQNTGKHNYVTTTLTFGWSVNGLTTNSGSSVATTVGAQLRSYASYPFIGATTLYKEVEGSFSAQPVTNTIIDFCAVGVTAAANPFTPLDGAGFRLTSAGVIGFINNNGTETTVGPFNFTSVDGSPSYTNNKKYQFIIQISSRRVLWWIDNVLVGTQETPVGQGAPFMAAAVQGFVRHVNTGVPNGVIQFALNSEFTTLGGPDLADPGSTVGNRMMGSYQGLSGGTMGSLANHANSANPTAAVPTNTTAALGSGLGGQFWETDTLAVTTDGIISSYQVPAGTVSVPGKRLVVRGVTISSAVQTALTGGGYVASWSLAFGHTAVSLATAEAATTKAPRRIPLGFQTVAAAAAALALLGTVSIQFDCPVYVNPGEFIAVVKKKIGTAPSAGVIAHLVTFDYGWE